MSHLSATVPDLTATPDWLCDHYQRIVFIAHGHQLDGLDPTDHTTLVLSLDWLAWRRWVDRGGHGLHFEYFLTTLFSGAPEERGYLMSACRWMYVDGADATMFDGVSLGKLFNWQVSSAFHAINRFWIAVNRALDRFSPLRVAVRGLRVEYEFLDQDGLLALLRRAVHDRNLTLELDLIPPQPGWVFPELHYDRELPPEPRLRSVLRSAFEWSVEKLFNVASWFRRRRPRVLIFHNPLMVQALIGEAEGAPVEPVLLAGTQPKRPTDLLALLRAGVHLIGRPVIRLNNRDRQTLASMQKLLEDAWQHRPATDPIEESLRAIIRTVVFGGQELAMRATEVRIYGRMFRRQRIDCLMVGDSENHTCRMLLELARQRGVPCDELLNGMFLSYQQMDARCGDGFHPAAIDRLLSWNRGNEIWLKETGATASACRTGYPVVDLMRARKAGPAPRNGNALILPPHVDRSDVAALYGNVYSAVLLAIGAARRAGFTNIRVKVHPGFNDIRYYQEVLAYCGASCELYKDGALAEHIHWSDVVIGPVNSGAFVETLATGRPYVPFLIRPSALEPALYVGITVAENVEELDALLQTTTRADEAALDILSDRQPTLSAARRVWNAIAEACN
ncbi:hypothetical protein [Magnetospirillum gryphiswaldense]|uniref:Uncharacterized protein n=1 Tax=Magnetospirillum gryphiswaldense TaxID=55518 RepID=A4U3N6_9PROT|nr:hypothetical protein [Magnetospirillum gryphiswaldense]AVM74864.1 hypothetical protein MSR1_23810 [Magnetospirillum gryphiswaldense MSR-1]AVM78767.1 hypothetical protein MSR1L_23810 [Magnetospirillum gryphiswaldense]CAM77493.1 conserved hypothetical protein [Magnetospirillum gryphiswaldense MSR-1]